MNQSSKILRYGVPTGDPSLASSESAAVIERHIQKHVGNPGLVLHEVGSRYVHVDVHIVPPQSGRDFSTLITSGMSDRPMNVPEQAKGLEYAELILCLPCSWTMKKYEVMSDE